MGLRVPRGVPVSAGALGLDTLDSPFSGPKTGTRGENIAVLPCPREEETEARTGTAAARTCGMPYWSMTCQICQSSLGMIS